MSAQVELWRVSTPEGVFETDIDTLRQWISEGCVLPTDKVSKGNLNWIDAGRAPMLRSAFNGEFATAVPEPEPPASTDQLWSSEQTDESDPSFNYESRTAVHAPANACYNHPELLPGFVCRMCFAEFCVDCPNYVSSSKIPLCPLCGELCKPYEQVITQAANASFQSSGFGFDDFTRAIGYPFQHMPALIFGALFYGLMMLGGFRTGVIGYVIIFGCMSHVISQVAWGRLNRSFMPDFSAFSLWDDLVVPIFLGIGIMIVSWGPMIALCVVLILGVASRAPTVSPLPAGEQETAEQTVGPTEKDFEVLTDPNADPHRLAEANRRLNETRPANQIVREAERSKKEQSDPLGAARHLLPYLGAGLVILVAFLITILWGFFYYPMALAVAGYTQSFSSVINPAVGIDTIRRMGSTYFKAFGMVMMVQVVQLIMAVLIAIVTAPFYLPFVGNLPAKFIAGTFSFYFNLVIACLLGLSLFKCADRLGISVD